MKKFSNNMNEENNKKICKNIYNKMSYLQADVYYKKKDEKKKGDFLDRRKFRSQQSDEEKTFKGIMETFEKFGISDSVVISKEFMEMKRIYQLNKDLLVSAYLYFEEKEFTFENVQKNFDEDFENVLNSLSSLGLFKKMFSKKLFFDFRQDFLMYLFLLNDFYQNRDDSESRSFEESFGSSEYYDDGFDPKQEDVYDQIEKVPKDELDFAE
tara:strand:- start:4665 stop:5297 length:633 start_codon:yes stop_codon:yes gene_type:complete